VTSAELKYSAGASSIHITYKPLDICDFFLVSFSLLQLLALSRSDTLTGLGLQRSTTVVALRRDGGPRRWDESFYGRKGSSLNYAL